MTYRTTALFVASLALTFTAACGDGSFGLSDSSTTVRQEVRPSDKGGGGGGKTSGSYNCKRDKKVDVAASLDAVTPLSSMKVRLTTSPGSDESGQAQTAFFIFEDDAGTQHIVSPTHREECPIGELDDPADLTVEPLEPGAHYRVSVVTRDICNNTVESAPVDLVMPELPDDLAGPTVSDILQVRVAVFMSNMPGVAIFADDSDSAIDRVEFLIDGALLGVHSRNDALHAWSDPQGEVYYTYFTPDQMGQSAEITAIAYDAFGNASSTTRTITVPAY